MPTLLSLTTTDEIRAVLGVGDKELKDATLNLPIYESMWQSELGDIYVGLPTLLDDIILRLDQDPTSVTPVEKQLLETVKVFSAYATSKTLYTNRAFTPKRITDGKAEVERFADSFAALMDGIYSMYRSLLVRIRRLLRMLGLDVPEPVYTSVIMAAAPLSVDPVVGE